MKEEDRQYAQSGGSRSGGGYGYRQRGGGRDFESPDYNRDYQDLGAREGSDWRDEDRSSRDRGPGADQRGSRYASRRTGGESERWGGSYDEDRDRNIIDRVVSEVRSWFNDDRELGRDAGRDRDFGRDRGGNYPDYGSDYARAYTGREYGRDFESEGRHGRARGSRSGGRSDRPRSSSESDWREERSEWSGADYTPRTSFVYSEFWLVPGPHSGIGPKGYRRSKDRVRDEICERLEQHGQIDASDIEIDVQDDGEVKLTGTVERRDIKRLVEDVAESVFGVHDVQNQIRVRRRERSGPDFTRDETYKEGLTGSTARTEQAAQKARTDH